MLKVLLNRIHNELGPGYSESVYHNALEVELRAANIQYETERIIPISYRGHVIGNLRADIIIENSLIVELKAVRALTDDHVDQVRRYLQLTGVGQGMAVNFGKRLEMREVTAQSFSNPILDVEEGICLQLERS